MPDYRVREWTLSLIMTPDRAAAVVGDMVEEGRSTFGCWTAIASHLAHAITPGVAGLALAGFLAQFVLGAIAVTGLSPALFFLLRHGGADWVEVFHWCSVAAFVAIQLLTGYWIGRTGRHRALLLGLMVTLLDCAIGALHVNNASINMAFWAVPLMAGTLLYRRRRRYAGA